MENIFFKPLAVLFWWEVQQLTLNDLLSKSEKTLLYFYPKDDTPWCTLENKDFSSLKEKFLDVWIQIIWISKDSVASHKQFVSTYSLQVPLVSDEDLEIHKFFGAYWEKNNYWKIVSWVIRSTFLLDKNGNILKSWKNVKATNHAEKLLKELG